MAHVAQLDGNTLHSSIHCHLYTTVHACNMLTAKHFKGVIAVYTSCTGQDCSHAVPQLDVATDFMQAQRTMELHAGCVH